MSSKSYPTDITQQTQAMIDAWKQIDPALKVGDLTPDSLTAMLAQAAPLLSEINTAEARLTDARNRRDALYDALWQCLKRIRSAIKGIYGDDSSQYEMAGGTRLSERKPAVRKPKPAA